MNEPMVKIAGLYEKTSQKGNRYFIGRLNGARLLMFANPGKQSDTDPDWYLYVQEREEQKGEAGGDRRLTARPKPQAPDAGGIDGGDYPARRRSGAF